MAFDGITIANIVHELNRNLLDGRINKIAQPETDELLLTIKTPGGQRRLSISASASLPLIYLTEGNKPSPMTAPNFCMLLRKHINNGRITKIWQPKLERIIHFEIEHLDELGDLCKKELIVEIMGKHSNIIFCNEDGTIIDSIKHVSSQISSVREVLPGRTYFIPDTMEKSDPLSVSFAEFQRVLTEKPMPLAKAVYTSFTGISPVVAEEICYLSGIDSALTPRELSEDLLTHLYRQFTLYFEEVTAGHFSPAIYYHGAEPKEFSALPLTHFSQYIRKEYDSISRLLEDYYAEKNTLTRIRQKSVDLRRVVQTALERNRKKYDLQAKQLRDTENREKFKVYGELIHTYGYNLEPGAKKLEALNYYTNEMITIPLDSTKTPQENALKYFEKYNKQKRTFEALTSLIEETRDDISYLESVSNALDIALSEDDLTQIKEELIESGYIRRKFTKKKVKITSKPFHYLSSDGYHIYVGKNNLQNEELTFHFASGNDWWFHAKGIPGSHVIVKTNGEELPDRTFEEAGKLAAYYSKNRGSEKIEIDYIEKKHVKKPKGGKPGFVVYYTNYSLMIDSDISQIKQLED
ncbi:putative ribosome quality control (RQC) complex YloA/Tae2 family protein [Faecalimonas umbilicata]|uniref:Rqc2 homolog RqcH n=1 Tax=Faecalimonas umbilicata TaxID=1912855 RepID=A0A4R3JKW9_9FIRM|nr:NFACT RNA binding domain-containing protein [Faecalimonas umbilicata]TCS65560.1 putative ribosome quality control (RQC) complex YloA/Tae2 family protein [Faecalimonas umbilicata]GBU06635.1 fibronectin-binding protein A [Faecalimonas umbilicata]